MWINLEVKACLPSIFQKTYLYKIPFIKEKHLLLHALKHLLLMWEIHVLYLFTGLSLHSWYIRTKTKRKNFFLLDQMSGYLWRKSCVMFQVPDSYRFSVLLALFTIRKGPTWLVFLKLKTSSQNEENIKSIFLMWEGMFIWLHLKIAKLHPT